MMDYYELYKNCTICPRACGVDRRGCVGFCGESDKLSIDTALLHNGEEPCISIGNGSGTIFFTGCSLRCPFCQNMQISQQTNDKHYYSEDEFVEIIIKLEQLGAANINFVTPDHFMPHILNAVRKLRAGNFSLPFIYNCSGYESLNHLEAVAGDIDIFLIDYKFADKEAAISCIKTPDYPETALNGLKFLVNKKGNLKLDDNGRAVSGVLIRHLVMPGFIENTRNVINDIFLEFGSSQFVSLMSQYTPGFFKGECASLHRHIYQDEYDNAVGLLQQLGFTNTYIQETDLKNDPFIPDFPSKKMYDIW